MIQSIPDGLMCIIACHGGPGDHLATFTKKAIEEGYGLHVYASGPALTKFQEKNIRPITPLNIESLSEEHRNDLARQMAKTCSNVSKVVTDGGHPFSIELHKAFKEEAPHIRRFVYYDNPGNYVPVYSSFFSQIVPLVDKILFSNINLVDKPIYQEPSIEIELPKEKRHGIGYFSIEQAEKIAKRRETERDTIRARFFYENNIQDTGQKIYPFFGGNNGEYFEHAFPAFLNILLESLSHINLSQAIFVLQQHPGAVNKNIEKTKLLDWQQNTPNALQFIISTWHSDDMQVLADRVLYHQTSMSVLFVISQIPLLQIGHKTYIDGPVQTGICPSITNSDEFIKNMEQIKPITQKDQEAIFHYLGKAEDWFQRFQNAITS